MLSPTRELINVAKHLCILLTQSLYILMRYLPWQQIELVAVVPKLTGPKRRRERTLHSGM